MNSTGSRRLAQVLQKHEADLLTDWVKEQKASPAHRPDLVKESELRDQGREFLALLRQAADRGDVTQPDGPGWQEVRTLLGEVSRARARVGFTPTATATFIFSFKQPLFARLRQEFDKDPKALSEETWNASTLLDKFGLYTMEVHQQAREEVIARQQREMLELSTPVVKLWEGILALPLIGTLDSARTQTVMENLLQKVVETGSETAIIDITGVPTVDTLTAQHLLKTVAAARLMGADCIISGIRPQIAQTIIHLGVDLSSVTTKATMADAFSLALKRGGYALSKPAQGRTV